MEGYPDTNYDKLIESVFPAATRWYTQRDYPALAGLMRDWDFAIVKVHGDVDRCETIVLGQEDYPEAMYSNEAFRVFLENVFTSGTVLFVGCSLTDPDLLLFLDHLKYQLRGQLRGHYALMETRRMNALERRDFQRSYGILALRKSPGWSSGAKAMKQAPTPEPRMPTGLRFRRPLPKYAALTNGDQLLSNSPT